MEFHHVVPHEGDVDGEVEKSEDNPASADPPIWSEVIYHCFYSIVLL